MNIVQKFFGHLKTVLKHKWWVFYYCSYARMPFRGLKHDISKFHPVEFFESVKYYSGTRSPIDVCKEDKGYSSAWFHHKGKNKHHYEYWVDNLDRGGIPVEMPYKYTVEMLCDYLGAGKAYHGKNFNFKKELEWWEHKRNICCMHQVQKTFLDMALHGLVSGGVAVLNKRQLKQYFITAKMRYDYAQKYIQKESINE